MHGLVEREASATATSASCCARVGLDPALQAALPAPVLRRAAQPHRHRARARGEARVPGVRRGGGRARRLDPGADPQPVHGAARRARPHLPLHQPRPRRGRAPLRPRGHHVPRARGRVGARRRSSSTRPNHPYTAGAARRGAAPRRAARRQFVADPRRDPVAARAAAGLPLPSALPARDAALQDRAPRLREIAPGRLSACHLNDAPADASPPAEAEVTA